MIWIWVGFIALILGLMSLDLFVLNRKAHEIRTREALGWTGMFVTLALCFNALVYFMYQHHWLGIGEVVGEHLSGQDAAIKFFTGWVVEYSLSLDNIFVFAVIFQYFAVPPVYQHRVLFWGILGALVMRGVMIAAGTALIERFSWIIYLFGALLIATANKMLFTQHDQIDPARNPLVRLAQRIYSVTPSIGGKEFFVRLADGRWAMTPLFLVLLVVESTDVLFAVDSIPAIFAITTDPFLIFTSNVFAILGLRSLYFALAGMMKQFRYLKFSLVFVLAYVGVKMIAGHALKSPENPEPIPTGFSLAVIAVTLATGILASVMAPSRRKSVGSAAEE